MNRQFGIAIIITGIIITPAICDAAKPDDRMFG